MKPPKTTNEMNQAERLLLAFYRAREEARGAEDPDPRVRQQEMPIGTGNASKFLDMPTEQRNAAMASMDSLFENDWAVPHGEPNNTGQFYPGVVLLPAGIRRGKELLEASNG